METKCQIREIFVKKVSVIVIGSVIAAYGITLAFGAGYGGATLAVLWEGVAETFHLSIGMASFVIAAWMLLFVFFFDRKQIQIGTVLYQVIYSYFVNVFVRLHIYSEQRWINFLLMITGIIIFAFGTALYSATNFGRGAYEAVTFALVERKHWQVKWVRMTQDLLVVGIGYFLGGEIGICTVCTIIMSGFFIQKSLKVIRAFEKHIQKK